MECFSHHRLVEVQGQQIRLVNQLGIALHKLEDAELHLRIVHLWELPHPGKPADAEIPVGAKQGLREGVLPALDARLQAAQRSPCGRRGIRTAASRPPGRWPFRAR